MCCHFAEKSGLNCCLSMKYISYIMPISSYIRSLLVGGSDFSHLHVIDEVFKIFLLAGRSVCTSFLSLIFHPLNEVSPTSGRDDDTTFIIDVFMNANKKIYKCICRKVHFNNNMYLCIHFRKFMKFLMHEI